ncbi:hypothetical protein [Breoghania sp.]|uniref:hypothetical protein n=1 Tax=Breoghania sp. TaxID=2065378 RepID=UPI002AAC2411|nr:hypothetical protein [Breoghania sp.]
MIFSGAEIRNSVLGVWYLFKGDPEGLRGFDASIGGFWRSFLLVVLIAAPYLLITSAQVDVYLEEMVDVPEGGVDLSLVATLLMLALNWFAFPLVLAILAAPLGIGQKFVQYIVVRNWVEMVAIVPLAFAALIYKAGIFNSEAFAFVTLFATGMTFFLRFRAAHITFESGIAFAAGIVAFDTMLSIVLEMLAARIFVGG